MFSNGEPQSESFAAHDTVLVAVYINGVLVGAILLFNGVFELFAFSEHDVLAKACVLAVFTQRLYHSMEPRAFSLRERTETNGGYTGLCFKLAQRVKFAYGAFAESFCARLSGGSFRILFLGGLFFAYLSIGIAAAL